MASYVAGDLATIFEVEHGKVSVGGGPVTEWVLRTTTTFRRENGTWRSSTATQIPSARRAMRARCARVRHLAALQARWMYRLENSRAAKTRRRWLKAPPPAK